MRPFPVLLAVAPLVAALIAAVLLLGASSPAASPGGTVSDGGGAPLAGVTVTALRADGVVAISVVTDAAGRFDLPDLPAGLYTLRARRIGYEVGTLPGYDPHGSPPAAFALQPTANLFAQMPASAFLALLPDGEEKRAFILDCAGCHQFDQRIVAPGAQLRSHASWVSRIDQMIGFAGASTPFPIISPSRTARSGAQSGLKAIVLAGNSITIVEPSKNRPISSPCRSAIVRSG